MSINDLDKFWFGTMTFGNKGIFKHIGTGEKEKCYGIINQLYDMGIRNYDTAYGYSDGESEKILGEALRPFRNFVSVSSKVSKSIIGAKKLDLSYDNIIRSCMASLKNLKIDYIDIFYLHNYDEENTLEESFDALEWLCDNSLIKSYGVCNFPPRQLEKALRLGSKKFSSVQYKCSFIEDDYSQEILNCLEGSEKILFGYSMLSGGLLTSKYIDNCHKYNNRHKRLNIELSEEIKANIINFHKKSLNHNISPEQEAIRYVMKKVDHAIFGATNMEQINKIMQAIENEYSRKV